MKSWSIFLILAVALSISGLCSTAAERKLPSPHTVIVLLEAKPGAEAELKKALLAVADESRAEESCLEYSVYQDAGIPAKFGLYEKWKSRELHQEQFTKPYILEFARKAEALLAKPYEGLFGEQIYPSNP